MRMGIHGRWAQKEYDLEAQSRKSASTKYVRREGGKVMKTSRIGGAAVLAVVAMALASAHNAQATFDWPPVNGVFPGKSWTPQSSARGEVAIFDRVTAEVARGNSAHEADGMRSFTDGSGWQWVSSSGGRTEGTGPDLIQVSWLLEWNGLRPSDHDDSIPIYLKTLQCGTMVSAVEADYEKDKGGNWNWRYTLPSLIPRPGTMIAGALLLLPFGVSTIRFLRKNRAA
jgi:hypothetical protein